MVAKHKDYGDFNSYDLLKIVAIITMIIDHFGLFFFKDIEILRVIGRVAYVIFIFCVGYNKKYDFNLNIFSIALLMAALDYIYKSHDFSWLFIFYSSILFDILFTRFVMSYLIKILNQNNIYIITFIIWCADFLTFHFIQYGTAGIAIALCGYITRENKVLLLDRSRFLFINLIFYASFEAIRAKFSLSSSIILLIEFLVIYKVFLNFKIISFNLNQHLQKYLSLISRHSLIIYFIHYECFYLISILLGKTL